MVGNTRRPAEGWEEQLVLQASASMDGRPPPIKMSRETGHDTPALLPVLGHTSPTVGVTG